MRYVHHLLIPVLVSLAACSPKVETDAELATRAGAPLFEGMGDFHRDIDTKDQAAQRYFDQGMVLAFGFNHAESIRSFRAAQKLVGTRTSLDQVTSASTADHVMPAVAMPVFVVTSVWMLVAMIVAVRQALDYRSTARAVAVCVLGWVLALTIAIVLGVVFGPTLS